MLYRLSERHTSGALVDIIDTSRRDTHLILTSQFWQTIGNAIMTTYKIILDDAEKTTVLMTKEQIAAQFADEFEPQATLMIASDLIHDLVNRVHDADKDYIEMAFAKNQYEVIDADEAAKRTGLDPFDADMYSEMGYEDPIDGFCDDVCSDLEAHINTYHNSDGVWFLVLKS